MGKSLLEKRVERSVVGTVAVVVAVAVAVAFAVVAVVVALRAFHLNSVCSSATPPPRLYSI